MKLLIHTMLVAASVIAVAEAQGTIRAGRAIEIRIQGVPSEEMQRVNNTYPVSESGYIRMPFIGAVRAAGMNSSNLAQSIENRYKSSKIYTSPTIQVISSTDDQVEEYVVTIGGQVKQPGPVRYSRGLTLYNAVQAAGGPSPFGSMYRVKLIRNGKLKEYNLKETEAKGVLVKPNDTIEVPQKNWLGR
jgi:polysaccharide export outer membrane protein